MPHTKLFIPGPTEVRPEVLQELDRPMIGHRSAEFSQLFRRLQRRLRRLFKTGHRVYISTSSGTGLWEAAVRNCVRTRCLNLVNGAFSERWRKVTLANGKRSVAVEVDWGQAVKPKQVEEELERERVDAVTLVYNETSTGVLNPIREIAEVIHQFPDVLFLVDAVSALGGVDTPVDELGIDVCLASPQKALALPPGFALASVSDRALARALEVENRGYYFDFLVFEKYLARDQTPTTPPVSLLYGLDRQLDRILAEGLEARFQRHQAMAHTVQSWARERGFELFAEDGYRSPTVTVVRNTRGIDVQALRAHLRKRGMIIADGYGPLKGQTFRIAHMGDLTPAEVEEVLAAVDDFLLR
ncbi:MAG: alanine--glyoxylate aminotransferase family protein [Chloroflexota bacterium]|nr:alanine--glyoxylate aminotransferase family protein [Chloroflexota bacterium]